MNITLQPGSAELAAVMQPRVRFLMDLPLYGRANVVWKRTPAEMRALIVRYERTVGNLEQVEMPVRHFYIEGRQASHVYAREITINHGIAAVGRVHKYPTINILSKGSVIVATEDGVKKLTAPYTWISQPGVKRALYTLEDIIWTTVHLTDELDESRIKDDLGFVSYGEYLTFCEEMGHERPALSA